MKPLICWLVGHRTRVIWVPVDPAGKRRRIAHHCERCEHNVRRPSAFDSHGIHKIMTALMAVCAVVATLVYFAIAEAIITAL